jgi:hypothetical protein
MSPEDPRDLTPVEQLLRLKRHEKPADDFVEHFLVAFHERQRSEMLKHSAHGLLWERAKMYWEEMGFSKWGYPVGAAAAAVAVFWFWQPEEKQESREMPLAALEGTVPETIGQDFPVDAVMILGSDPEETASIEEPMLLSRHFSGGYADDARQVKAIRQ